MDVRRAAAAACVVLFGCLGLLPVLGLSPAAAAPKTFTITYDDINGFQPAALKIPAGSLLKWQNLGPTDVHIVSGKGPWPSKIDITVTGTSTSAATKPLVRAGSYAYTGTTLIGTKAGAVTVPVAPRPSPSATRTASPTPRRTGTPSTPATAPATASPTPSPTATPTASPTPRPEPSPGSLVTETPPPPPPQKATRFDGVVVHGGERGLGLPVAVSALVCVGVVSAGVRVLLAEPLPAEPPVGPSA